MPELHWTLCDESQTERLGTTLAQVLAPGDVIALNGPLGAGKTRLVQAVAAACGVREDVTSPTFVLVHEYHGRLPIYHIDAYRLRDDDEFLELGPEEFFSAGGITLIEWADRVEACLPADVLTIRLELTGPTQRCATLSSSGPQSAARLASLASTT
jgi:tRNA threonylcarbamoyladenosine biosynthesis protein TsaE